ncbi:nucleotidyltransferase family protein [Halostella litorea]|uniref:nucleotidyltransferase family protein n=1 Tax=Halostella litorea TaxID=2528831 RepID=UPI001093282C|nr:nucleotidyltransferase family protein [Halostella litorea]
MTDQPGTRSDGASARRTDGGPEDGVDGANDADGPDDSATSPRVGGVVLAAGLGSRFEGGNKLLAEVDGRPVVERAAKTLRRSAVAEVVAVVGHEAERVTAAVDGLTDAVRRNEDYAAGQSTSVRVGVAAARERGWDAAVFMLGDMPFVRPATVDAVVAAYARGDGSIVAPAYDGRRGNPALFGKRHYDALADVSGDRGGRDLIETHEDSVLVDVDDPGVTRDVDFRADLESDAE